MDETAENKTKQIKGLLERIQKKLQVAALTDLAVLDKKNEGIQNIDMEQDNNKDFFDFVTKLEIDHVPEAKKLRVAYLYINLDEPLPFIPKVGTDKTEVKNILERIQKKLQTSAIKGLDVFDKMNTANDTQDKNGDFYVFIKKLEMDPTETIQMISKKLRVAYLYITLDEPKSEVAPAVLVAGSASSSVSPVLVAAPAAS